MDQSIVDYISSLSNSVHPEMSNDDHQLAATRARLLELYRQGKRKQFRKEAQEAGIPEEVIVDAAKRIFNESEVSDMEKKSIISSIRVLFVDNYIDSNYSDVPPAIQQRIKDDAFNMYQAMDAVIEIIASNPAVVNVAPEPTNKPIEFFFGQVEYAEMELREMYGRLIWDQWIEDTQTSEDDFVYFFTGIGHAPLKRIRWQKSSVALSFFIKRVSKDTRIWKVCSQVFEVRNNSLQYMPVDADRLNITYYSASRREKHSEVWGAVDKILDF